MSDSQHSQEDHAEPTLADAMRAAARTFPAADRSRDARVLGAVSAEWALRRLDSATFASADAARDERCLRGIEHGLAERRDRGSGSRRSRRRPIAAPALGLRLAYAAAAALVLALATWVIVDGGLFDGGQGAPRIVAPREPAPAPLDPSPGSTLPTSGVHTPTPSPFPPRLSFDRAVAAASEARDLPALERLLQTNPLHPERERLARAILELDEDHATSREILGQVLHHGRWITRDELLALGGQEHAAPAVELPPDLEFSRWMATASADPREWWAQHEWCAAKGLVREALVCAQRVLELDKDHEWTRLSLGQVRHEGRWIRRDELARYEPPGPREAANGSSSAVATGWATHFGGEPLCATTEHVEVWMQRPVHATSAAELARGLAEISRRLELSAKDFHARNPDAIPGVSGRLRVAVFTQADYYRGMCSTRDLAVAQDQGGVIVDSFTVAISPTLANASGLVPSSAAAPGRPADASLFYDDFLLAAREPDAPPERRVLWHSVLDAQERLAQPVVLAVGARFLVAAAASDPQAQALATGAVAKLELLVDRMSEEGLLLGHTFESSRPVGSGGGANAPARSERIAVVLTSGTDAWREAVARRPARVAHQACWAGSYEPARGLVIAESSYIETVLHAGAWVVLHQAAGRLASDTDLYWLHEGLAHYAAGSVLDPAAAVHPRWGPALARLYERGGVGIPLVSLIEAERGKFLASKAFAKREYQELAQAQSWALVHYLMRGPDRGTKARLLGWWASVPKQGGGFEGFRRHLEHSDTARLERDIHQHSKSLVK